MRALLTGELYGPLEMRFVSPEGVYYSREVDARPVEDPARGTLYIGYAKDITDQKNQTQELLEQAHQLSESVQQVKFWENDYDRVKRLLSSFQSDGMQTSLDDFGAGSSLLNNMVDIPVNTIKLDKLFLTRCSSNARGTDFLREIVHLVKRLGYNVICEGIETEEQVQLLRSLDCDGAQGFWFSKAIPAEEFERRYLCS